MMKEEEKENMYYPLTV